MWIHSHSHKHENCKDSNANIDAFLAVQFPAERLIADAAWWLCHIRGITNGDKGDTIPRAPNHYGAPKSPNNVTSTVFNTVHLLPKDRRFEHGGAKLASCPGRHLTSLRPCTTYTAGLRHMGWTWSS